MEREAWLDIARKLILRLGEPHRVGIDSEFLVDLANEQTTHQNQ